MRNQLDGDTQPLTAAGAAPGPAWLLGGGRYRVLDRVGAGGMAEVFRAHDELLDRDVAVKVFRAHLDDPDSATNGEIRREVELQAMAQLNHPNLVTLYDGSVSGEGASYLVLEFVEGRDLASRLRDGAMPEPEVRRLGVGLADALAYVHARGLVHRDVKPANILLGAEDGGGRPRLSDFGIVRMMGAPQVTSAELTLGTAHYLAPEQAQGSGVGPAADVYALGLVLLEALTGHRAYEGTVAEVLAARLAASPPIPADLPAPWPALLAAMTAPDPAARPGAATVAAQLRAAPGMLPPPAAPAPGRARRRRRPLLLAAAAAVLAAGAAFGASLLDVNGPAAPAGTNPSAPAGPRHSVPARHHSSAPSTKAGQQPVQVRLRSSAKPKKHHPSRRATKRPAAPAASTTPSPVARVSSSSSPAASSSSAPAGSTAPTPSPSPSTSSAAAVADPGVSTSPAGS